MHFVALEVVMEITHMYFESLNSPILKNVNHHHNLQKIGTKKEKLALCCAGTKEADEIEEH